MKLRHLAVASTFALVGTALSTPVLAQRPQSGAQSVFQRPPVSQAGRFDNNSPRDRDGRNDPREREMFNRYNGRDSRWQFAFRDGYNEGLRDARAHRRFDPVSNSQYRAANRGYGRGWGPRDQFAIQYRSAFRDGYERGYFDIAQRRTSWSLFFHWGR